jgi:hypothetical protein
MTVFDTMLDTIFASAIAIDASYLSADAPPLACRVIARQPDIEGDIGARNRGQQEAVTFEARVSEAPSVVAGAALDVGGVRYRITAVKRKDGDRRIWTIEAAP